MDALDAANSPAQLNGVLDGFQKLMTGQLSAFKTQYESSGGFKTGPFDFNSKLSPETIKALEPQSGGTPAPGTAAPTASASQAANAPKQRLTAQQALAQARQEIDQSGTPVPPDLYNIRVEQRALALMSGSAPRGQPAQAPAIPSWVKPGDQYSPSRGLARGADGTTYGQPTTNQPMFGR